MAATLKFTAFKQSTWSKESCEEGGIVLVSQQSLGTTVLLGEHGEWNNYLVLQ